MNFKITALRDVTVRAYMPYTEGRVIGGIPYPVTKQREQWVPIRKGESGGIGLVVGISTKSLPDEPAEIRNGVRLVPIWYKTEELPKEFYGLFRLEVGEQSQ